MSLKLLDGKSRKLHDPRDCSSSHGGLIYTWLWYLVPVQHWISKHATSDCDTRQHWSECICKSTQKLDSLGCIGCTFPRPPPPIPTLPYFWVPESPHTRLSLIHLHAPYWPIVHANLLVYHFVLVCSRNSGVGLCQPHKRTPLQKQVQSLPQALLRSLKQAPIDDNSLHWPSVNGVPSNLLGMMG